KGALLLMKTSGANNSAANFHSRESRKKNAHPVLTIEWADGTRSRLHPKADATITCSSVSGKGDKRDVKVGFGRSAALVFPFEKKSESVSAKLTLYSSNQFGSPFEIGAYRLDVPWAHEAKVTTGLAAQ